MGALLVGIPYVLWRAVGVPWPDQVHSWQDLVDRLMVPVGDPLAVQIMALLGWFCWFMFACSVLSEGAWYVRHLPQLCRERDVHAEHLQGLSAGRSVAALCVGTLVVALLGMWRPGDVVGVSHSVEALRAATIAAAPLRIDQPPSSDTRQRADREHPVRVVEYTVVEGDTLWDIAAVHMDDALKWPRIYALSKDRIQDDGGRLTDPDLIRPGWQLTIPVPAQAGTERVRPPLTGEEGGESAEMPAPEHSTPPDSSTREDGGPESQRPRPGWSRGEDSPAAIGIAGASVIGVTTAAGIAAAVLFRRGRVRRRETERVSGEPSGPPPARVVGAAEELTSNIRTALFTAQSPSMPPQRAEATFAEPAALKGRIHPQPPQPKGQVTIGTSGGREVGLALLSTRGGWVLTGPGKDAAARALIVGVLTAAERLRPGAPQVRLLLERSVAYELLGVAPEGLPALQLAADGGELIHVAEAGMVALLRHEAELEDARSGSLDKELGHVNEPDGQHLVVLARPEPATAPRLEALAVGAAPDALTVVALGELAGAGIVRVGDDGSVTLRGGHSQLPDDLVLFSLAQQDAADVLAVVRGAHEHSAVEREARTSNAPRSADGQVNHNADDDDRDKRSRDGEFGNADRRRVRIQLLGPVTVWISGNDAPLGIGMADETREFIALLAAHPAGIRSEEIALELRLSEDAKQVVTELKNLRRAVRRILRAGTGLEDEFIEVNGDRYRLNPELTETDVAEFTQLLRQAAATTDTEQRMHHIRAALRHYVGPFAEGCNYPWSEGIRQALRRKAGDATVRLAEYTAEHGDIDGALTLLDEAITADPTDESIYQRTIRLQRAAGRDDAARRTYDLLVHQLRSLDLAPTPETRALLNMPTTGGRRARHPVR
ncbi:BTAD domain-containing putative transcriptional regulator [Streptomyces sp. N35]|uniref:BTAD domain-containing putative transcriptional regulator n=1 Tax=Streptomyces sp. N35 TaxID=2795730 RepID=UPI0018F376E7|nr:BTAD domain-containing putative transcriptional regulator [Streptomyces sp. N35]